MMLPRIYGWLQRKVAPEVVRYSFVPPRPAPSIVQRESDAAREEIRRTWGKQIRLEVMASILKRPRPVWRSAMAPD